jgi:hypothetical protein
MVHSAVAARTYDGTIYAGNGAGTLGSTCWCANTFTPGSPKLIQEQIGQASYGKTGFGDLLVRAKGTNSAATHTFQNPCGTSGRIECGITPTETTVIAWLRITMELARR